MSPPDIPASGATPGPKESPLPDKKLVSWKEIATHLGRETRTVQRWEKTEGLPVRRHEHQKKSTVYAYTSELDEWFKRRQPADDPEADAAFVPDPETSEVNSGAETPDPAPLTPVAAPAVQYRLEGSVRLDGNHVRIDAQLIQVSDQTHLWADSYDRDVNDILRVQDDVATAVANQIRLALSPSGEKAAPRSVNPEAYDAYLRGRFYWTNRGDLHKSIEAYQLAIQKDPQYALAYAGLASAYALLGQVPYDDLSPIEAKPKARAAAEHALQLDPQLAEAHAVLANVSFSYDWNFETAEREFQRAFALGPNNPTPHLWYGHYCIIRNRLPQALEENSRTLDLDPVSPLFNTGRAEIQYHTRNYDAAIDQARRTAEQYPGYCLA